MSNAGAAYVFVRSGTTWTQQAYLKASNTAIEDRFGNAVAIHGDTIVVGAVREDSNAIGLGGNQADNSASYSGAAYVFVRNAGLWTQQAYVKASNTNADDKFAYALDLHGDTLAIGAVGEASNATGVNGNQANNNKSSAGAVYVYTRSGATWTQQAYLKASNTDSSDEFGVSVALDGDTLLVGALGEDGSATGVNGNQLDNTAVDSGAAYVFVRSGTTWTQQAYLKASNTGGGDTFGFDVALHGDFAAIGAFREDSAAVGVGGNQADDSLAEAGAAYTFRRSGTTWAQTSYLKASNTESGDLFGTVDVHGDSVAVGASGESSNATGVGGNQLDNSAFAAGALYVYDTNACPPLAAAQTVRVGTPPNPAAFLPSPGAGPVIGATWDPRIDHASFAPAAIFDIVALTAAPSPVDMPTSFGTILCNLAGPVFTVTGPAGVPFAFAIPADCALVGSGLCTQGVAVSAAGIELANALDLVIGSL
jgi:FG-GAP repeat